MQDPDFELRDAFERFLGQTDTTLMPTAFAQWLSEDHPQLLERLGVDEVLAFTQQYFAAPLHVESNAPPLKRKF